MKKQTISKRKRNIMVIIGIGVVLCLIATVIIVMTAKSSDKKLADQLELGQKYLNELDYEQAIVAYKAAIEIDPKCEDAYLALAEIYATIEDYEAAINILNQGVEQTDSEEMEIYLHELEQVGEGGSETKEEEEVEIIQENTDNQQTQSGEPREEISYWDDGRIWYVSEYNGGGNCIKRTYYNIDESVESVEEYEYDSDGNCIKRIYYTSDGSVENIGVYEYDGSSNCIKETYYGENGTVEVVIVLEYNSHNNCIKMTNYDADGSSYVCEYDNGGNLV